MIDDERALALIERFLEGEISQAEEEALVRWLEGAPESAAEFRGLLAQEHFLREVTDPDRAPDAFRRAMAQRLRAPGPDRAFKEDVLRKIRNGLAKPGPAPAASRPSPRTIRAMRWLASAAALGLAALIFVFALSPAGPAPSVPGLDLVRGEVWMITPSGETPARGGGEIPAGRGIRTAGAASRAGIVFPDGTRIEAGPGTTIREIQGRTIHLSAGSLSASIVAGDKAVVFTSPHAELEVLGGRLSLSIADDSTRLEVQSGRVRLTHREDKSAVDVVPDQYAVVARGTSIAVRPLVLPRDRSVTETFRQDVNGYIGARDASINTMRPRDNKGNGLTFPDAKFLTLLYIDEYESRGLLRFGKLGLPAGARVEAASLTLGVEGWARDAVVQGRYLNAAWNPDSRDDEGLGWLHRDQQVRWSAPGAEGEGTDLIPGKGFTLAGFEGKGRDVVTVDLDPAVVQEWVSNPSANHGILLINGVRQFSSRLALRVHASRNPIPSRRPMLSLTYRIP